MLMVAAVSPILSAMLPCNIECMVRHRASFKSDILLELLAGHIDTPEVVSRFATLSGELPADYSAAQLAQCLLRVAGDMHDVVCAEDKMDIPRRGTAGLLGLGVTLKKLGITASKYEHCDDLFELAATMAVCKAHPLPAPSLNLANHMDQYQKLLAVLPGAWQLGHGLRGCIALSLFRKRLFLAMLEGSEPDWHNVKAQSLTAYGPDTDGALARFPLNWSAAMASDWTGVPAWQISMWVSHMQDALAVNGATDIFNQACQLPHLRQLVLNHKMANGIPPSLHQLAVLATSLCTGHREPPAECRRLQP